MSSIKVSHALEFETEFVLDNMRPDMALAVQNMPPEQLQAMCNYALSESMKDLKFLDAIAGKSTWGLIKLAGE